ncbi:uncharacterized protein LOC110880609 [Helianthus annuus]|uniref:uncharacterized protein LOC110880609 n=1 Tax=Helianthus annuus TaxID=4232 RepID=UPI000B8F2CC8|nr:uncharacterized protein LOC110880609 [Helianthus annuus]
MKYGINGDRFSVNDFNGEGFQKFRSYDFGKIMDYFYDSGTLNRGCGSAFIALIPKVKDPANLGDYRPISLIGMVNKVISKVLALRLKKVTGSVVSFSQSAFLSGSFILDGPLMINESRYQIHYPLDLEMLEDFYINHESITSSSTLQQHTTKTPFFPLVRPPLVAPPPPPLDHFQAFYKHTKVLEGAQRSLVFSEIEGPLASAINRHISSFELP